MNKTLDMALVIEPILCMHEEMKLKPLNFSSCVFIFPSLFENLYKVDPNFLILCTKNQAVILFYGSQTNNSKNLIPAVLKNIISYLKATTFFDRPLISF